MNKTELMKVNIADLNDNARHLFEVSDGEALYDFFSDCKTVGEIDSMADEIAKEYPELFADA